MSSAIYSPTNIYSPSRQSRVELDFFPGCFKAYAICSFEVQDNTSLTLITSVCTKTYKSGLFPDTKKKSNYKTRTKHYWNRTHEELPDDTQSQSYTRALSALPAPWLKLSCWKKTMYCAIPLSIPGFATVTGRYYTHIAISWMLQIFV